MGEAEGRKELASIGRWRRLADYLSAAAACLREDFLLERPGAQAVPPPLHWSEVAVFNAMYAHLSRLARDHDTDVLLVQGLPLEAEAVRVNLWIDGSLGAIDAGCGHTRAGLERALRDFEWPAEVQGGRCSPEHAMFYARCLARESPEAVVACLVSADVPQRALSREACADPSAEGEEGQDAAWLANDLLEAGEGRVLPIVHRVEGIEEPLTEALEGYGYEIHRVEAGVRFEARLLEALDDARARLVEGRAPWPLVMVVTPRDLGLPPGLRDAPSAEAVEKWLRSYHVEHLLLPAGEPRPDVLDLAPPGGRRLGLRLLDAARRLVDNL